MFPHPLLAGILLVGAAAAPTAPSPGETSATSRVWRLPPLEIRATPLPDPLGPFPLTTTVLDRASLERRPGGDLAAALLPVAGLRVTSFGAPGLGSAASIRGSTTEQILVVVDEQRLNLAQGGGADLTTVPLESVESVEVFRGGASAIWGSDALAGAIHVRTRAPEPGTGRFRLAAGSHDELTATASGTLALAEAWAARAALRLHRYGGDYVFRDEDRERDRVARNSDVRRLSADLRCEGPAFAGSRLRCDLSGHDAERGVPGSEEFPTPTARLHDERVTATTRWSRPHGGTWLTTTTVSVLRADRRYHEPGAPFGGIDEAHRNLRTTGEIGLARATSGSAVRAGVGFASDRLRSTTDGERGRDTGFLRLRASGDIPGGRRARWLGAARLDVVDGFAPFLSPRLGARLDAIPERLTLRLSAGLSYRTPTFDDLFWPARATAAGNPDLRAERGRDVDLGATIGRLPLGGRLTVNAFLRTVTDLIQWLPGAGGIWRPHNVGRVRIAGVETEAEARVPLPLGTAWLGGSATFLDARDRTGERNVDGRTLPYRPRWSGTGSLRWETGRFGSLETTWRSVADVFVTRANTKVLPGYVVGDVRYRRRLGTAVALDVAVINVTNRSARDFRDYPLPGRTWTVGLGLATGPAGGAR